jgi:hypothetical protein
LIFGVREPARTAPRAFRFSLRAVNLGRLGAEYWLVVAIAAVGALARFSDAILVLRARAAGLPITLSLAVLVIMNMVYATAVYPAGALSDRLNRVAVLAVARS